MLSNIIQYIDRNDRLYRAGKLRSLIVYSTELHNILEQIEAELRQSLSIYAQYYDSYV